VKIVSNTGPIIGLAKIGRLDLLQSLTGEVLIPSSVHKELFGKTGAEATPIEVALSDFITVVPVNIADPSLASVMQNWMRERDRLLRLRPYSGRKCCFSTIMREGKQPRDWT
jgi:predicted nucleic acid-binding protein